MTTIVHRRVEAARKGENPAVVRRMPSGWAVMAEWQQLPGYMLLLPDPVVGSLNELTGRQRQQFLMDMALLGDALLEATDAIRINYQILGNLDPTLHAHVCPRYAWEPEELRKGPTAHYDKSAGPHFDAERDRELMDRIRTALDRLTA
jgi:diadenosine tetraphosphate (Ap4A) HIT family hydrolase